MRREPIYGLDLVRFFAASVVLIYHLGFKAFASPDYPLHLRMGGEAAAPPWSAESWWGWIGVQIFFVISGLVIAYSAEGASWRAFIRSRVGRLLPAMLICATFIALVAPIWDGITLAKAVFLWVKSVTFFPMGPWLSGQFWTLPIEICFYGLVWLMIVGGVSRHLEALAWALGLLSAAYWIGLSITGWTDTYGRLTQLLMLQHGCYFAIGVLLSVIDRQGLSPRHVGLGVVCLVPVWLQIQAATIAENPGYGLERLHAWPFAIWLVVVGVIAASLYWKTHITAIVGKHGATLRVLGLITYPLYLIHKHIGGPVLVGVVAMGAPGWLALVAAFAASGAAAWLIAVVMEPALHRVVSGLLKRLLPDASHKTAPVDKSTLTQPAP